jgi:hypothetical protein
MAQGKYIRFTVEPRKGKRVAEDGIFVAAYALSRGNELTAAAFDHLVDLLTWFSSNLAAPPRFNRSGGKGWHRRDTRGLSWFKPEASEHIAKIRELVAFLEQHDIYTRQFEETHVGYIVYEDDHQIVAEPFSDLR